MFHLGARSTEGEFPAPIDQQVSALLTQFGNAVERRSQALALRRAVVRSRLPCSLILIIDAGTLWVAAQKSNGLPSTISLRQPSQTYSAEAILTAARWDFGFEDPYVVAFPADLLERDPEVRQSAVEAIAVAHVQAEEARVTAQLNLVPINPIFGPAAYPLDERLAFVLMPFSDELTAIYETIIRPVVVGDEFHLVCRRADDIKSNRAILQDIWKSLCEARFVIADLTGFNANVLYELGIAHTIGKETILLYQRGAETRFPFDLAHIPAIRMKLSQNPHKPKLSPTRFELIRRLLRIPHLHRVPRSSCRRGACRNRPATSAPTDLE